MFSGMGHAGGQIVRIVLGSISFVASLFLSPILTSIDSTFSKLCSSLIFIGVYELTSNYLGEKESILGDCLQHRGSGCTSVSNGLYLYCPFTSVLP